MIISYAIEYTGYLCSTFAGIDLANLDLDSTCEHYWSSGYCDPIESIGQKPRYTVKEVEVPDWLITGLSVNHDIVNELATKICSGYWDTCDFYRCLRYLTIGKPGKFYRSLIEQFTITGKLSSKQEYCVLNPPKFNSRY